ATSSRPTGLRPRPRSQTPLSPLRGPSPTVLQEFDPSTFRLSFWHKRWARWRQPGYLNGCCMSLFLASRFWGLKRGSGRIFRHTFGNLNRMDAQVKALRGWIENGSQIAIAVGRG